MYICVFGEVKNTARIANISSKINKIDLIFFLQQTQKTLYLAQKWK